MADNNTIARPYARAVFRVAQDNDALAEVAASLDAGRQILSDGQVGKFLANPSLSDEQRLEFLTDLFGKAAGKESVFGGSSEHGVNFLRLLLEFGRVGVFPDI